MFGEAVRKGLSSIRLLPHQVEFVESVICAPHQRVLKPPTPKGRTSRVMAMKYGGRTG